MVKSHLDILNEGAQQLQAYDAELTDEAVQAVRNAHNVRVQVAQLQEIDNETADSEAAAEAVAAQLARERSWVEIQAIDDSLAVVRARYISERQRLLAWQGHQVGQTARIKGRNGFSTLTSDQSYRVLRP